MRALEVSPLVELSFCKLCATDVFVTLTFWDAQQQRVCVASTVVILASEIDSLCDRNICVFRCCQVVREHGHIHQDLSGAATCKPPFLSHGLFPEAKLKRAAFWHMGTIFLLTSDCLEAITARVVDNIDRCVGQWWLGCWKDATRGNRMEKHLRLWAITTFDCITKKRELFTGLWKK